MDDVPGNAGRRFGRIQTDALTAQQLREALQRALETGPSLRITYANAHNVCVAENDADYRSALSAFDIVFPEGEGLARAARMLGYASHEKFHTTDFWSTLFPLFRERHAALFLLGSTKSTLQKAAAKFATEGLTVAGVADGFDDARDAESTVRAIRSSGASVLLVGMGVPRQEQWVAANAAALDLRVIICMGNYFEFAAGTVKRAPLFLRRLGLEWLHRMVAEPRRLWKRYMLGIPRFWGIVRRQKRTAG